MKLTDLVTLIAPTPKSVKLFARRYWTAKIGGAEATGKTSDQAITALGKTIARVFDGNYTPYALPFRGWLGLAWRSPRGWEYHFYNVAEEFGPKEGTVFLLRSCNGADTEQEVVKRLRAHLADVAWDGEEEASPIIIDEQDQERFGRDARWQKRYRALKATGMEDAAIRAQLLNERL
jgi:hypothetical protein